MSRSWREVLAQFAAADGRRTETIAAAVMAGRRGTLDNAGTSWDPGSAYRGPGRIESGTVTARVCGYCLQSNSQTFVFAAEWVPDEVVEALAESSRENPWDWGIEKALDRAIGDMSRLSRPEYVFHLCRETMGNPICGAGWETYRWQEVVLADQPRTPGAQYCAACVAALGH